MKPSLKLFYIIGFLFSLYTALITYSNSSFLSQFISNSSIGLVYSGGSVLAILGLILVPKLISRLGSRITSIFLVLIIISFCIVNIFVTTPIVIAISFCFLFAANVMFFLSNDIAIDQISPEESVGTIRGKYLTSLNLAYVLAPLATGYLLARMGFPALYGAAVLLLIPLLWPILKATQFSQTHKSKVSIIASLITLWKDKDIRNILFANFILQFFYAWMVIYTPIYLHTEIGIPWDSIGTIFSIMLFAFVLTQIPLGKLADKVLGEKKLLFIGFLVMGISTLMLYMHPYFTLPLLALVLFTTRLGASCVEIMTETYFFKKVPATETGVISIFRNTYPISYIVAPIIASGIIAVSSTKHLFLVLGIICLCGIFFVLPIRNIK